jgi:beta-aspartyl-peptidase (threonine type)
MEIKMPAMLFLNHRNMLVFAIMAVSAICSGCNRAQNPSDGTREIRAVLDGQVEDWNKHNLDGFANGYWRSPNLVFQSGTTRTDGWDGMRDRYRKGYESEGKEMGHLEFGNVEITMLGADSAFVRGQWKLTMSNGSKPGGLFTLILRKFPEGWKIVHDHTS